MVRNFTGKFCNEEIWNENYEIIKQIAIERNITNHSINNYISSLTLYSEFNKMSIKELLKEAEQEEDERIPLKRRSIKRRLLNFRSYLYNKYLKNTASFYTSIVITFYNHFEIEIPKLPAISNKNLNESEPVNYFDLLDKDIIKLALDRCNPLDTAIMLFMVSSGCSISETLNITIQDFINATSNKASHYHDSNDIYEVVNILKDEEGIIPTFKLKRQKTKKYFYTFCSPEATHYIVTYLSDTSRTLKSDDKLFKISKSTFSKHLLKLNNELKLGKKGTYNRLRSHMFRKFHASALHSDGMSKDIIRTIQGKGKNLTDEAYFFENPITLKQEYTDHVEAVSINWTVKSLSVKSPEFAVMEKTLNETSKEHDMLKEKVLNMEDVLNKFVSDEDYSIMDKYF